MLRTYNNWIARKQVRQYLLGILFLLSFLQSIQLVEIKTLSGGIPVSIVYLFSIVFIPWLLTHIKDLRLPPWYISGLFVYVIVYAAIASFRWGISRTILNWIYGAYLLVVVLTFSRDFSWEDWKKVLGYVALLFAVAHIINCFLNWNAITKIIFNTVHRNYTMSLTAATSYQSLTRGGRNLDATWLCLSTFFVPDRWKIPYWAYGLLFSLLFFSRVGIIICALFLIWYLFTKRKQIKLSRMHIILLVSLLVAVGAGLYFSGILTVLFKRFTGIGVDKPFLEAILSGRKPILDRTWSMFQDNPFGYGCGNAMSVMKANYGFTSYEGVTHNVFTQFLLDEGFLGGLWFLGLSIAFIIKEAKMKFQHPLAMYFLSYLVLSLVQFHGGEGQMQFVLGVYISVRILGERNAISKTADPNIALGQQDIPTSEESAQ